MGSVMPGDGVEQLDVVTCVSHSDDGMDGVVGVGWTVKVEGMNDVACVPSSDVGATVAVGAGPATPVVDWLGSTSVAGTVVVGVESTAGGGARPWKLHGTLWRGREAVGRWVQVLLCRRRSRRRRVHGRCRCWMHGDGR